MTRSTRKLVFTQEGDTLLADARRIVAEWDAAISGLREDGPLAGPIRITATNDFGCVRLRPLLDAFQMRHPGVHMTLLLDDSPIDLVGEHVDLAIRSGPLPDSSLRARLLVRGPRVVCASPLYWSRAGLPRHPNDLVDHNCLILARPGAPLPTWTFSDLDRSVNVKVSGDVLREWASAGIGVIFKNLWDIRAEIAAGTLVTALDGFVTRQVDLYAVHAGGPPGRRVMALIDFLADALRKPPASAETLLPLDQGTSAVD